MENQVKLVETLVEKAAEYGKTSYELLKLKALDKTADVVSSLIPHSVVFVFLVSFMLFFNLGLAFWLGNILGELFWGFFVVAGFYIVLGAVLHFFLHDRIKKTIFNFIIKQVLS
ncbi:MAG: phage holin family protein [Bacteroidetes bacterium]|nr:phage holin family protein [Bacteroidota bacterium]MBU1719353.1 phage holin family protein [Bacteroidota bacterium]